MEFLKGETAGKGGRGYSKLSPVPDIDDLICLLRVSSCPTQCASLPLYLMKGEH